MAKRIGLLVAIISLFTAAALALFIVRPPGPGHVYSYRSDQYGLSESTALLLRKGECLALSRSEEDIGSSQAGSGSHRRLWAIAGNERITAGSTESGPYLRDSSTGLVARPGDAIDGE